MKTNNVILALCMSVFCVCVSICGCLHLCQVCVHICGQRSGGNEGYCIVFKALATFCSSHLELCQTTERMMTEVTVDVIFWDKYVPPGDSLNNSTRVLFSLTASRILQGINQDSVEIPATTLASCCVRVMGLTRRASTMAEAIFLACLSSPYARRMDARACWSKVFTTSAAQGMSGYLRTKRSPIKLLDVTSLLTVANPDNSEIQLKTLMADSYEENDCKGLRRHMQLKQ